MKHCYEQDGGNSKSYICVLKNCCVGVISTIFFFELQSPMALTSCHLSKQIFMQFGEKIRTT